MLDDDAERIEDALKDVYRLALGGTAIGAGINAVSGFAEAVAVEIAALTGLPCAGSSRCTGAAFWLSSHSGGVAVQGRERHPAHVLPSARGFCRTVDPG